MDNKPRVDEKWIGSNRQTFLVTRVVVVDGKTWVHYEKLSDGSKYNCLEESFTARYTKLANENY